MSSPPVKDGVVVVVKSECPTCQLVVPVLEQLASDIDLMVFTQDDPTFPAEAQWVVDDTDLLVSWGLNLDAVPTLLRFEDGHEVERTTGWQRAAWEGLTGQKGLGLDLPPFKPG
ncbi:MAG TPA: thioredoxin family protein [Acidimicrobiales bacterium]|nr:thioredoxin family protein [Acidimicrobiales bacterium]